MDTTTLTYAGLLLRPFDDADADAFAAAALESIDTVGRWMPWCTADFSARDALDWFAACRAAHEAGTAYEYGLFCQDSGALLGGAGLNQIVQQHKFCNLGYWVRQSRQGEKVASRCVQALAAHAFSQLGLARVEIVIAEGNLASQGVAEKCGALHERIARNRLVLRGASLPAHVYSLVP